MSQNKSDVQQEAGDATNITGDHNRVERKPLDITVKFVAIGCIVFSVVVMGGMTLAAFVAALQIIMSQ